MSAQKPNTDVLQEPANFNFRSITCVCWNASGRNVAFGTPDGVTIFSTERVLQFECEKADKKKQHAEEGTKRQQPTTTAADTSSSIHAAAGDDTDAATSAADIGSSDNNNNNISSSSVQVKPHMVEVCRRVIEGGVGLLSIHGQSSIVAVAGVRSIADASTVSLIDVSRPLLASSSVATPPGHRDGRGGDDDDADDASGSDYDDDDDGGGGGEACSLAMLGATPSSAQFQPLTLSDLRPLVLAKATFPSTVAAISCCPHFIMVALTGDPRVVGSHLVYVFDLHLQQKFIFHAFPPRSNTFLQDCFAVATMWAPTVAAGVSVKRLRALLPGERKGQVRLLTLKTTSVNREASDNNNNKNNNEPERAAHCGSSDGDSDSHETGEGGHHHHHQRHHTNDGLFVTGELAVHQSALRAVAITEDGRRGVTIGESGTKIKLFDLIDDSKVVERMTLNRGRTNAIVDSVSLRILSLPLPADAASSSSAATARGTTTPAASSSLSARHAHGTELVVCVTSTGTIHLFLCDVAARTVVYSREKTLCPPRFVYPSSFSVVFPQPSTHATHCSLYVLQWDHNWAGTRFLAHHQQQQQQHSSSSNRQQSARGSVGGDAHHRNTSVGGSGLTDTAGEVRLVTFSVDIKVPTAASASRQPYGGSYYQHVDRALAAAPDAAASVVCEPRLYIPVFPDVLPREGNL